MLDAMVNAVAQRWTTALPVIGLTVGICLNVCKRTRDIEKILSSEQRIKKQQLIKMLQRLAVPFKRVNICINSYIFITSIIIILSSCNL